MQPIQTSDLQQNYHQHEYHHCVSRLLRLVRSSGFAQPVSQLIRARSQGADEMYGTRLRVVESLLARQAFCIIADKQNFDAAACWEQLLCTPRHIRRGYRLCGAHVDGNLALLRSRVVAPRKHWD